jgi:catechol 2,3-dioxygenase
MSIDRATHVDSVQLTVSDLDRSVRFYTERIGFVEHGRDGAVATMGAADRALLVLHESRSAPRARRTTGLYHFAILVPTRSDLARAFRHLVEAGTHFQGYSDHLVSEAIYLADPDGNGIEIYRDRPRDEWPFMDGRLQMGSLPLDIQNLVADAGTAPWRGMPAGTFIGHVHLHVAHLDEGERFYRDALGFDLILRYAGTASFLSAGGYHHHVAINTWAGEGAPPPPAGAIGLHHVVLRVPSHDALAAVGDSLTNAGLTFSGDRDHISVSDPSGNVLEIVV